MTQMEMDMLLSSANSAGILQKKILSINVIL